MKPVLILVAILSVSATVQSAILGGQVNCEEGDERLVIDPNNKNNYLQCDNGHYTSRQCAPGTSFNEQEQTCTVQGNGPITGKVTCDDWIWLYVDGELNAYKRGWRTAKTVNFPDTTLSVAIRCFDTGGIGGIKAAFDNNVRTDGSWKCSNKFEDGWNAWNFDDSSWEDSTVQTHKGWGERPKALNDGLTRWIWTKGDRQDRNVYCRKRLYSETCDYSWPTVRLVKDPTNCLVFKQCDNGKYVTKPCPDGTGFNEVLQTCVALTDLPNCN